MKNQEEKTSKDEQPNQEGGAGIIIGLLSLAASIYVLYVVFFG